MELTDKRVTYTVANESEKVRFAGASASVENGVLRSLSGSATSTDGTKSGWFNCQEDTGNVNWNYNGSPDIEDDVRDLVRATVEEFRAHLAAEDESE